MAPTDYGPVLRSVRSIAFWLMMQLGMIIGYFNSWPANVWLVKRGIKVPM
jgi:Domain of unknown function (DUF4396)